MADIAALLVKKDQLIDRIANLTAAVENRRRALARAESDLKFTTDPARRGRLESQISELERDVAAFASDIPGLNQQLSAVNNQIAQAQSQQGAQASAGQQVKQAQTARDDGASTINPPPPVQVAEDGRVVPAQNRPPSNAQRRAPGETDSGTNAATRRISNTQSTPPITAQPGGVRPSASQPYPSNTSGAGSSSDDNSGGSGVRATLNNLFGGENNRVVPQDNILDNYASYTYNIAVYLMNPVEYSKMIQSKKKTIAGYQLLFMSGGAGPAGSVVPNDQITAQDPVLAAQERVSNLGRNEFFSLDYYIDDVQITSLLSGYGTGGPTNATEIKFKVIEPNSMTFLPNLYRACQQYIQTGAQDVNKNYSAQSYLMVIRFYGYDDQGNLVKVNRTGSGSAGSDANAVVEKFIPFLLTGVKFRIANKVVEYECTAKAIPDVVNKHPARGTIPYNVELQSQTIRNLLVGQSKFAAANDREGRVAPATTQAAPGIREVQGLGNIGDTPAA
jgi:hypothetical protein